MTMQATPGQLVGQRVRRREDPRLVKGRGNYVDDMKLPGMLHLAFKRSDVAHGIIRSIDTSAAEAMDGRRGWYYTGAQIADMVPPMPVATPFPAPDHHSGRPGARPLRRRARRRRRCDRPLHRGRRGRRRSRWTSRSCRPLSTPSGRWQTATPSPSTTTFENNLAVPLAASGTGRERRRRARSRTTRRSMTPSKSADVVISQRMMNQRLVPNAMEPRGIDRALRAGQGRTDRLVDDAEPAYRAHAAGGHPRDGPARGARDRPGRGRRLRQQDQRLRRGFRRGRDLAPTWGGRSSGSRTAPRPS